MPTAVPIDPARLIDVARQLAEHHVGPGRPRPVWLRRGVSSAYYALFHALARQAAAHLVPTAPLHRQLEVARSFAHVALKEVCEWIARRRGNSPQHARALIQSLRGTSIEDVAAVFCDLQEARHLADYDHRAPVSKAAVLGYAQDAEQAIEKLRAASQRDRELLFALLALRTAIR